jgi:hypothetical protein
VLPSCYLFKIEEARPKRQDPDDQVLERAECDPPSDSLVLRSQHPACQSQVFELRSLPPLWPRGLNDELNCNAYGLYYKLVSLRSIISNPLNANPCSISALAQRTCARRKARALRPELAKVVGK